MAITESGSKANLFQGALRSKSDATPAHYVLNIEKVSTLSKLGIGRYESNEFEAGGYKWKLVIHPNGNKTKNAEQFLSAYIAMADPTSLPPGWEVYATFRIFLLDQNNDNYLKVEDVLRKGRRFHLLKTEWGFDQFISRNAFGDSRNGYLVGDKCVFGAEVFVCKETSKGKTESLSMVKYAFPYKSKWRIDSSKLDNDSESSDIFNVGGHKWMMLLYPNKRVNDYNHGYLSLYLALAEPNNLPSGTKILVEYSLCILDQLGTRNIFRKGIQWFAKGRSRWRGWGWFVAHETFFDKNRGLLYKDACYVEAEVKIHGETTVSG